MKPKWYLAYKIISKTPATGIAAEINPSRLLHMIEDLLYRIQAKVDVATTEAAIARLPTEYGLVLDLYYVGEVSRTEIAHLLDWSPGTVSQRLTRGISLVKWQLNPAAFENAVTILCQSPPKRETKSRRCNCPG